MHGSDFGHEGIPALFGRFECRGLPFLDFAIRAITLQVDLGAITLERDNPGRTDLGRLADDGVHELPLGQRLSQRDFVRQRFDSLLEADFEDRAVLAVTDQVTDPLIALSVERHHRVAHTCSIHHHEMVRFIRGQREFGRFSRRWSAEGTEVGHGSS